MTPKVQLKYFNAHGSRQALPNPYTGCATPENVPAQVHIRGVDGRGWKGNVKNMLLDISKIKAPGWKPNTTPNRPYEKQHNKQ